MWAKLQPSRCLLSNDFQNGWDIGPREAMATVIRLRLLVCTISPAAEDVQFGVIRLEMSKDLLFASKPSAQKTTDPRPEWDRRTYGWLKDGLAEVNQRSTKTIFMWLK